MKANRLKPSFFKRLINWSHLWLGLISGIVVLVVSLTGCIYVFQQDIKDALEPWRFVQQQECDFVPPGQLIDTAQTYVPNHKPTGLTYAGKTGAAAVGFEYDNNGKENFIAVFINPYTGRLIRTRKTIGEGSFDFFRFIIEGHRYLWLPPKIGKPIVGSATLIFVVLLITGLIMWWPKNLKKTQRKKAFSIKWSAKFKRLNYDLHNVLGFYSLVVALIIALTGLVISFSWFKNGVHYLASGSQQTTMSYPRSHPSYGKRRPVKQVLNKTWKEVVQQEGDRAKGMYAGPDLSKKTAPVLIIAYHDSGSFYDRNTYYFDQYTLERIHRPNDTYIKADFADKLMMLNYDMHIGTALGWFGKILAFLASLIAASLPITGFLYWYKKPKKARKTRFRDF